MRALTPLGATGPITANTAPTMGKANRYNASAGNLAATLPALSAWNVGDNLVVEKDTLDGSANTITLTRAGSDVFDDGTASVVLSATGQKLHLQVVQPASTKVWKVIGGYNPGGGSGGGGTATWGTLSGKPAVIAAGADQAAARSAIGALSSTEISALITTAFGNLVAGAPGALDTWLELTAAIQADETALATLTTLIGTKQPGDPTLTALAAMTTAADKLIYATGSDAFATTDLSAFARTVLDDADAATARTTLGAASLTQAASYTGGNRWVSFGDSITQKDETALLRTCAWPTIASLVSRQRLNLVRNAGVSGNTSADLVARFATDVAAYKPTVVTIQSGRNDINTSVAFSTYQANVRSLVASTRAIGALPILVTIPPTNTTGQRQTTVDWNKWLRIYAAQAGVPLFDMYSILADPTTGLYTAGLYADTFHPNSAGHSLLGVALASQLDDYLPPNDVRMVLDQADTTNLFGAGGFFPTLSVDSFKQPNGSGWGFLDSNAPASAAVTPAPAGILGNVYTATFAGPAGISTLYKNVSVVPSHTYLFAGKIKANLGGAAFNAISYIFGDNTSAYALFGAVTDMADWGHFFTLFTTTSAAQTQASFQFQVAAGASGTLSLAELQAVDLTALGLDAALVSGQAI